MEKSNYVNLNPMDIETDSMAIITKELAHISFPVELSDIIKRVIHTTADFEYAQLLEAHPQAVELCKKALQSGCKIYADTSMIVAGVGKPSLNELGCSIHNYVHDADVVAKAKELEITRSIAGIDKAVSDNLFKIYIVGNAPTALVRLCELYKQKKINPALVIGVPVGFVGAAESKEMLKNSGMPYIIVRGRKGGSTVGVAILNAISYQLYRS